MAQLSVDLTGYYESMIKGQWSFDDAFNEQPHNTFDNGGTRIDLSFYSKEANKLTIEKDEKDKEIQNFQKEQERHVPSTSLFLALNKH